MSVGGIWRSNAVILVLLVFVNLMLMSLPELIWIVVGILMLLGAMFLSYRQGGAIGHEACSVLKTVERAQDPASPTHGQLDSKTMKQAYNVSTGIKSIFASALVPYVINCVYIIVMLLQTSSEGLLFGSRLAAWIVSLPFWPLICHWHEAFDVLSADIVIMLMASPFLLPVCTFLGYLQGPKLWQKTEVAMAQGKRRAKAKSRVVKKKQVRTQKPEI
ncbi:MAG: hypothetical protein IJ240_04285 [Clostridia bacterium]|nr:hypothetical protein [Clostridia bacterium]